MPCRFPDKHTPDFGYAEMLSMSELNNADSTFCKASHVWVGVSVNPPAGAGKMPVMANSQSGCC